MHGEDLDEGTMPGVAHFMPRVGGGLHAADDY